MSAWRIFGFIVLWPLAPIAVPVLVTIFALMIIVEIVKALPNNY